MADRPNILVLMCGHHRFDALSCLGDVSLVNYNALDGIHVTRIGVDWFCG